MNRIKNIILAAGMIFLAACIKPFSPEIDSNQASKYVVSGRVTNVEGWQEVDISRSSPVSSPAVIPVSACQVKILDNTGNTFSLEEFEPGQYHVWMGQEYLAEGRSFKVRITTPDGENLESGSDTIPDGPPVDSVYYALEDIPTTDPSVSNRVMQFYVDLNGIGYSSRFYKWEVTETWEYHAAHRAEYYYDGHEHRIDPPDNSKRVCYATRQVKNIFTVSTKNLESNVYHQYRLHSIDGHSSRLSILYSIQVRQYALREEAYNYWEKLRINSNEQGGLYERQPLAIKGNISDVSNPEKDVLGYFYAAAMTERRYFYSKIQGIELNFDNGCREEERGIGGWANVSPDEYPVYYYINPVIGLRLLTKECIDCRLMGGSLEKPSFWPN
jgi:hypothetical protein